MELLFNTLQDLLQVKAEIIRSKITDLGNLVTCVKKYNRSLENIRPVVWINILFNLNNGTSSFTLFSTEKEALTCFELY